MATKINKKEWAEKHQDFEQKWWGECVNTYDEEKKQRFYAQKMGLEFTQFANRSFIDKRGKMILDVGGGAVSLLLKTKFERGAVVEPMPLPLWVQMRYAVADIHLSQQPAEEMTLTGGWDEIWIYNVLQHTFNPEKILKECRKDSKLIRIFEWLDTPAHEGHPITLTEKNLNKWLGGEGRVERLDPEEWGGYNKAYYGVFKGDLYDK